MEEIQKAENRKTRTIVSEIGSDGTLIEIVHDREQARTLLARLQGAGVERSESIDFEGEHLIPVPATNNLIKHQAVLLAERPVPYESIATLIESIRGHIYKYVDLSEQFLSIASYYVLLTWVYDAFNELPYLRFRGDYGSGKTRALYIIGSICYKPFFASGASTVSPIFHTLDLFRGTLIFDEADFRFSDEKSELVKIFNNGNVRGFPVLRTAITAKREFDPRAFTVFGPKIVAMRKSFDDPALESRFITEEMGVRPMRPGIPINLPDTQKEEALSLRNQLLMYRFTVRNTIKLDDTLYDASLSPRLNQIVIPLLSIIDDEKLRDEVRSAVRGHDERLYAERSSSMEAGILEVIAHMLNQDTYTVLPLSEITDEFRIRYSTEYERPITNRVVGSVIRKRLRLLTYKRNGVYVVPLSEAPKIHELCHRYGVTEAQHR